MGMTENEFRQLIACTEGETLDFKREEYNLQNSNSRNDFIKDILAMANTPRDECARIVLGVSWTPEHGSTVSGLVHQFDDVEFQNALGQDRVNPYPRFTYTPIEFNGKQVGVLDIPISNGGPYTPLKDYEGLQAGAVYYRRGTKNDRAVGSELKRIINWFQRGHIGSPAELRNDAWPRFFEAVHGFDPATTYVLAADRIPSSTPAPLNALAMIPWRAIIDFDPESEASGLLSRLAGPLGRHRVIHRVVRGEYQVQPEPGTHWFFARGLSGRQETLAHDTHKAWVRAYKKELGKQLEGVARTISPRPVVVIVLWSDVAFRNHLRTLIEEVLGTFGEEVEVVLVSDDAPSFESFEEDEEATFVQIGLRSLCGGVAVHYADLESTSDERCVLPTSAGGPTEVKLDDWLWLRENLEIIHRSAGIGGDDDPGHYRRGGDISWRNLQLRHDCDRDITPKVIQRVEADLKQRHTVRINLYHEPGGGGTTVGRRIAWELHNTYPVCILRKCEPHDTAERIAKIAALTESSVLVVVDGEQQSERDIDNLFEFLRANQTPTVLLQVLRRFRRQKEGKRQFWLDAALSDSEADRFRNAYVQASPSKKTALENLAKQHNSPQRNAFFFGITAFLKDYRGLERYVYSRVTGLTDEQQRILAYIAIAHYFGHQPVPAQAFASLLGLPRSKTFDLASAFADTSSQALDLVIESVQKGDWRTTHPLVALEIMQQIFAPANSTEREAVWRQKLSFWAKNFANFCRGDGHTISDRLLDLVRRVFVYRDNIEVLGTERASHKQFAQLIHSIPSGYGQLEVLRHLTECFPLEAHFHAHLGRFLSLTGEHDQGLESIESALSLQPDDPVLHHMKGMTLRQKMKAAAQKGVPIDQLVGIAKQAAECFEESRRLCPDEAHSYVSEVQTLIELLDEAGKGRRNVLHKVLTQSGSDPFLRQALDRAEGLLDQAQNLHAGEEPNEYVLECRARLQRIYGDYSDALQVWDGLLSRSGVAKPPVRRQIIWTILRRHDGAWHSLTRKETDRVRQLLEENLEEEINDSSSLRLWLRAIRQSQTPPSLDAIIEKVGYWKVNTGALDAVYYLYVLHTIRALEGSSQSAADAARALEECRALARFRRDRTRSFEWVGPGKGINTLVHQSRLGEWKDGFWEYTDALIRLNGLVVSIDGQQKGLIELDPGIKAFFIPGKADLHSSRDENTRVTCYLGLSYDGPRAWGVQQTGS